MSTEQLEMINNLLSHSEYGSSLGRRGMSRVKNMKTVFRRREPVEVPVNSLVNKLKAVYKVLKEMKNDNFPTPELLTKDLQLVNQYIFGSLLMPENPGLLLTIFKKLYILIEGNSVQPELEQMVLDIHGIMSKQGSANQWLHGSGSESDLFLSQTPENYNIITPPRLKMNR